MIKFCPLFSSSSGNSVYIGEHGSGILIDVGRSAKQITEMLIKTNIEPTSIKAIFITHEHSDHIKGLSVFAAKYNIPVYASTGTLLTLKQKGILTGKHTDIALNDSPVYIDRLKIEAFCTSHDCTDGRGYIITGSDGTTRIAIATDTGYLPTEILAKITGCKLVYLESNYDKNMLRNGPYSYQLQRRIDSDIGHLSNNACCDLLRALVNKGTTHFVLAHLSRENNTPEVALEAVRGSLNNEGLVENEDFEICVAPREDARMLIF